MRYLYSCLIATSLATSLNACAGEEAATKKEKAAAVSTRQEVTLRLARATEAGGDYAGAEKMFVQVVEQSPTAAGPQLELAEFYKRHREDGKAIISLENALKYIPGNADIERDLANTYIGLGKPEKALATLEPAIAEHADNPLLYNSQGVALDQMGSYEEAQKSYRKANALDPGNGTMYKVNSSMSYILAGSYNKAIALLRPMLDAPDAPPIVRQNLALAYGLKGESDTALKLGLQDLSESEAAENLKFYRMLALKHSPAAASGQKTGSTAVPPSVINELFPEEEPAASAAATPPSSITMVAPVTITPAQMPVAQTAAPKKAPVKAAAIAPDEEADDTPSAANTPKPAYGPAIPAQLQTTTTAAKPLFVPVTAASLKIKPAVARDEEDEDDSADAEKPAIKTVAARIKPATEDDEDNDDDDDNKNSASLGTEKSGPAPASSPHVEVILPPAALSAPVLPVKTAGLKATPAVKDDEDDGDDEDTSSLPAAGPSKPFAALSPSSGHVSATDEAGNSASVIVVSPDEGSLPQPILKPDRY